MFVTKKYFNSQVGELNAKLETLTNKMADSIDQGAESHNMISDTQTIAKLLYSQAPRFRKFDTVRKGGEKYMVNNILTYNDGGELSNIYDLHPLKQELKQEFVKEAELG